MKKLSFLIQAPAEDTAYKRVLKKYFYLKKGDIEVILTNHKTDMWRQRLLACC